MLILMQIPRSSHEEYQKPSIEFHPRRRSYWYDPVRSLHWSIRTTRGDHLDDPFPCSRMYILLFILTINRWLTWFWQGIALSTASSGKTVTGMLWMMIISRGIAGVGAGNWVLASPRFQDLRANWVAGGEYTVYTAQALESADNGGQSLRKRRGFLVVVSTNLAIVAGFTFSSIVSLIVIAAYGNKASEGIWRICFAIGIIVSLLLSPMSYFLTLYDC